MSSNDGSSFSAAGVRLRDSGAAFPSGVVLLHASLPLTWIAQAGLIAYAVSRIGDGSPHVVLSAVGVLLLTLCRALAESWCERRLFDHARSTLSAWRSHGLEVLSGESPLDRRKMPAGEAASAIAEQAEALLPWLTRYRSASWRVRIVPAAILLPVFWLSWASGLVLLVAAPLIPLFMAIVGWQAREAGREHWKELGNMNAFLLDRLRGLPTLRALDAVDISANALRKQGDALRAKAMRVLRIAFLSSAVLELFSALGVAMVAVYIGFHLLGHLEFGTWNGPLTLGEGLFILLLAPAFFEPLRELSAVWHDRASGQAAMETLESITRREARLPLPPTHEQHALTDLSRDAAADSSHCFTRTPGHEGCANDHAHPPGIRIRGLHFCFPGRPAVLEDFGMDVAPREHVAIVGPSGAGKSALLALIGGLVAPGRGRIEFLDEQGRPVGRPRMGWLDQNPHVFAAGIARNVSLDRPEVDAGRIANAISIAGLSAIPQARSPIALGEQGRGLSAGEIRRLGLARLAADPGLQLMLADEPTANLDRQTAEQTIEALLSIAHGKTLIVATHDPDLICRMDRVIRIPEPGCTERGMP